TAPAALPAPPPPPASAARRVVVELATLRLLHDRGIISQADYDATMRDLTESVGLHGTDSSALVLGRFSTALYGFVEADHIFDSTESLNDVAGNTQIARPGTYAGDHPRLTFGLRNSRIGLRIAAPEVYGIRASAMLEMDFQGNQPVGITEAAFYVNPAFRM